MVQCVECGFLGTVDPASGELRLADLSCRNSGYQLASHGKRAPAEFCCLKGVETFSGKAEPTIGQRVASVRVEIDCGQFVRWSGSKTPQEHERMQYEQEQLQILREQVRVTQIQAVIALVLGSVAIGLTVLQLILSSR